MTEILRCDNCEREKNRRYTSPGTLCECGGAYRVAQSTTTPADPNRYTDVRAAADAADVANEAVHEAAFYWCVMNSILTEGNVYRNEEIREAINRYFPGGWHRFTGDLPGSTDGTPLKGA